MTTATKTMLDIQEAIDRSGYYFAACEGNGIIRAIPRGTADCASGYRDGFYVKVGVRGGLTVWHERNGATEPADAAKGKDARMVLAINTQP